MKFATSSTSLPVGGGSTHYYIGKGRFDFANSGGDGYYIMSTSMDRNKCWQYHNDMYGGNYFQENYHMYARSIRPVKE